jgi:hypothetical protein
MKHFYLLLTLTLLLAACSKDEFDPLKPKNGEVVELFVDHYISGSDQRIFLSADRKKSLGTYVDKFPGRELGYTYVVKAKVVVPSEYLWDGPSYWFDYIETIRKEKFQGQDTLTLPIYGAVGPFPTIFVRKETDQYYYSEGRLTPVDNTVKANLDTAIAKAGTLLDQLPPPKPGALYVKHDPNNYGKGYIVYRVVLQ